MRFGAERISSVQRDLLERSKRESSPSTVLHSLVNLVEDGDIAQDREDVHPDWLEVFQRYLPAIQTLAPKSAIEKISSFFEKLHPFDDEIKRLDPADLNISFLLGAGASKPPPSGIPTVKELLPQLLERARRIDRDDVNQLADFCERRKIDNIEDLLTAAQLATFSSKNPNVLQLMNYLLYRRDSNDVYEEYRDFWDPDRFRVRKVRGMRETAADLSSVAFLQDTLQVLFGLLSSTMLPAKPNAAHEAIAGYVKKRPASSIVTTNYDCCMDLALGDLKQDFDYRIEFANMNDTKLPERTQASVRLLKAPRES